MFNMKNRIPIQVHNVSESSKRFKKSEKYQIFVEFGIKSYHFTSKKKALSFSVKFSKELTVKFKNLMVLASRINTHLISFLHQIDFKQSDSLLDSYSYIHSMYNKILHGIETKHLFSHVFSVVSTLENLIINLKSLVRTHNRNQSLHSTLVMEKQYFDSLKSSLNDTIYSFIDSNSIIKFPNLKIA